MFSNSSGATLFDALFLISTEDTKNSSDKLTFFTFLTPFHYYFVFMQPVKNKTRLVFLRPKSSSIDFTEKTPLDFKLSKNIGPSQ